MRRDLLQKIRNLEPAREVPVDIAELADIPEGKPNLFENTFPHVEPPRLMFEGKVVERIDGKDVEFDFEERKKAPLNITDTTFRDGQQARPPYTLEQMVDIYRLLGKLSGPNKVITATEFFLYTDNDIAAVEACLDEYASHPSYPEPTGWIRGLSDDTMYLKLMQHLGVKETGILTSCSDYHVFTKLKKNWKTAAQEYLGMAKQAAERDIRVRFHLEDVTRANIEEFVYPFLEMVAKLSEELPEHLKSRIRLCDTMGFGLPYPGLELPRSVPKLIYKVRQAGIPSDRIEWHGHNDFHHVIANGVAAWLYGCDALNGTLLGFGERTGNPPVEGAAIMYQAIKGPSGIDTTVITEIADYFRSIGVVIPPNYPFVGDDSNRTRAGIHGGGLAADERIYQIFDTTKILDKPPSITITDKSGLEGIGYWVQCLLSQSVAGRAEVTVKKIQLVEITEWVNYQYNTLERTTGISDDEMTGQVLLHMPGAAVPAFINNRYGLKGDARISDDDCGPVVAAIQEEKKKLKEEYKAQGKGAEPVSGISVDAMESLIYQHIPQLKK